MEETKDVTKNTTAKKNVKKGTPTKKEKSNVQEGVDAFAVISLVLGGASMILWAYPLFGISVSIPGLALGIVTHETKRSNYSLIGIVMCLVGLILSLVKLFAR